MSAVDELWLVCGVSLAEIKAMRLDELVFWMGRAVGFFDKGRSAAPKSAAGAVQTAQIEAYVRALRG